MKDCIKYFIISTNLIKRLMKDEKVTLLDIIFKNLKFFDRDFILHLLLCYQRKIAVSSSNLNHQIFNEKFKISLNKTNFSDSTCKYLINECNKKIINMNIIKCLIEYGININEKDYFGRTPLYIACLNGNETLVKHLVEYGADIDKKCENGKTPLYKACENGKTPLYKACKNGKTPLYKACENENEAIIKYLVEHGADINKEKKDGETPLFKACKSGNEAIVK